MLGHQNLSPQMYGKKSHFLVFLVALNRLVQAGGRGKTELWHVSTNENLQGATQ